MNILLICIKIDINCTHLVMVPTMPPATEAKVVVTADLKYQITMLAAITMDI